MVEQKKVYKCDNCHEYFDQGFQYKTNWTEVGANEPTEYCTLLCEKCFYKWRNERVKH